MDAAMRLLADHPELPLGELVTHRFRLEDWRQAMATALDRRSSGALKVAFTPAAMRDARQLATGGGAGPHVD
jgi:threonine dehydrogenase-like Zn-dependent dehydrogenase